MAKPPHSPPVTLVCAAALSLAATTCGPRSRRDLATIPQRQITFDDLCGLQEYFDERRAARAPAFRVIDEQSTETEREEADESGRMRRVVIGEGTYLVTDRAARRQLQRLLRDEYTGLPPVRLLGREAGPVGVQVHVHWWASGQMRRLRPDREIEVRTQSQTLTLPFNPCIGEFLFGDMAYGMRRHVLDSDTARAHGEIPDLPPAAGGADAGAPSAAAGPDGGAAAGPDGGAAAGPDGGAARD